MDISLNLNCELSKGFCFSNKQRSSRVNLRNMKTNVVSCKVKEFSTKTNNFYHLLSLSSENVGFEEIKKAYRSKALQFHPDVCPSSIKEECTKQFVELRKAYEVLSDPDSRRMYDYELSLADSSCGLGKLGSIGRREVFRKEVWEGQLSGLRKQSGDRLERKKNRV